MILSKRKYLCDSAKVTRIYATDDNLNETQIHEEITRGVIKYRIQLSEKEEVVTVKKMYAIYAGMVDSFGGKIFRYFGSYKNEEYALGDAREIAIGEYKSYEDGSHGVPSKEKCEETGINYDEVVESWIDYSAKEVSYEDIISISKEEGLDLDCICKALNELNLCNKLQYWRSKDEDSE